MKSEAGLIDFPVVGIGASAGGLEVISKILSSLPDSPGMSFFVVQHLDRTYDSHLAEILSKNARLSVVEAKNKTPIEPNVIYVVRSKFDLTLVDNQINLSKRDEEATSNSSIDSLFISLARSKKSKAIGVVLTGMGSDGTLGLEAIKSEGGVTIAQDPQTAKFDSMPRNAVASGKVDLILPVEEIAAELARLARHPYHQTQMVDKHSDEKGESPTLDKIINILKAHTQVNFSKYKLTTLNRRIQRQMMIVKIRSIEKYAEHLKNNPTDVKSLYDDIFIHVTDFFRDAESFKSLEKNILPELVKDQSNKTPLRVWVPGCSTGEEAYSLAILIRDFIISHSSNRPVQIFATDISEYAIQKARKGIYSEFQMKNLSKIQRKVSFDKIPEGYKIKKFIRDMCIFSRHDVTSNPPIPKLDLISCRNVFIYFATDLQKRVLPVFHYALNPGGFLWLGKSETPGTMSKLFSPVDKTNKIYTKISGPSPLHAPLRESHYLVENLPRISHYSPAKNAQKNADQIILLKYAPPGVIINNDLEIIQFRGRTTPYLELPAGQATLNLLKMANSELTPVLRLGFQSAKKKNSVFKKERVTFTHEGKHKTVNIEITPINPLDPVRERQFLILFEDGSTKNKSAKTKKKKEKKSSGRLGQKASHLLQELAESREYQQSLIEQYETGQEELTSSNEELQSTNEELQSTNEELSTAKEELQSANEELTSMNDELQKRNSDLSTTEDHLRDLNEILEKRVTDRETQFQVFADSIPQMAWMAQPDGYVFWYNQRWYNYTGTIEKDMEGWGWQSVYDPKELPKVLELWKDAIASGDSFEITSPIRGADGKFKWFLTRVTPVVSSKGKVVRWFGTNTNIDEQLRASNAQTFLNETSSVLSSTLDIDESLRLIANLVVKDLADLCILDMLDDNGEYSFHIAHDDPKILALAKQFRGKFPLDWTAESGPAHVIRTGQSEIYRVITDDIITNTALNDEHLQIRRQLGIRSAMVVPFSARGKNLGALTLVLTHAGQNFDDYDLTLAQELGRRAGLSVDNARLFQQAKDAIQARDEFLSIASHELKTPLTSLKLQVQMTERSLDPSRNLAPSSEKLAKVLSTSSRQISRLEGLVEDLLDVAKIRSGKLTLRLEEVHLASLVRDVMERFEAQFKDQGAPVHIELSEEIIGFWDKSHIEQVLVNLISNALKYAPRKAIKISTVKEDDEIQITVKDYGPGIPREKHQLIFERFERATSSRKISGLGLGLFIVKQIVESHHGSIKVESEIGSGAEFIIRLPLRTDLS